MGFFNADPLAANISLLHLDLVGCAIMLWPALDTPGFKGWVNASKVLGMGRNKAVLGIRSADVNYMQTSTSGNHFPWPYGTAVAVYSDANALVGNVLVRASTKQAPETLKLLYKGGGKAGPGPYTAKTTYPYDNRYGIDVNQILLGTVARKSCPGWGATDPKCFPHQYSPGVTIRDSWVHQNGRGGVVFSGAGDGRVIGSGPQVRNNHVEVQAGTVFYTRDGVHFATGSDTNENRGYNVQGYASNITGCSGHVNSQALVCPTPEDPSKLCPWHTVDGEGILQQAFESGSGYRHSWRGNDLTGGGGPSGAPVWFYDLVDVVDCVIEDN